jgi:hypothetical protein
MEKIAGVRTPSGDGGLMAGDFTPTTIKEDPVFTLIITYSRLSGIR